MTFAEAIPILAGGDRVSRDGWDEGSVEVDQLLAEGSPDYLCEWRGGDPSIWCPTLTDLTASDWYVLPLREWTEETNSRQ